MKKSVWFPVIVVTLFVSLTACGKTLEQVDGTDKKDEASSEQHDQVIVRSEPILIQYDKNELVNESDAIVSGIVLSQEVQKDFEGFPATDTLIQVQTVYKGKPAETVEIRADGGEMEDIIHIVDVPTPLSFTIGEEVIVFLSHNKGSRTDKEDFGYYVVGQAQGKFNIDPPSEASIQNDTGTHRFDFQNFQHEIDQIEAYNEKHHIPRLTLPEGQESQI